VGAVAGGVHGNHRQTSKEVVQRTFDALNDRDRESFVQLHADDAVLHFVDEEIRGVEAITAEEWEHFDAFPDLTLIPDAMLAEDDTVAVRWTAVGTHEGEFNGIEPTGTEVEYSLMGMFRVKDGTIAKVWLAADRLGLMQQLGVINPLTG
jgi:steroid delta-isomerase-like uncharacterized protein